MVGREVKSVVLPQRRKEGGGRRGRLLEFFFPFLAFREREETKFPPSFLLLQQVGRGYGTLYFPISIFCSKRNKIVLESFHF